MTELSLDRRFTSATAALQALEQPAAITPLAVKPFGSKIMLTKRADALEIVMPSKGFSFEVVFLGLFAIAWSSFLVNWVGIGLSTTGVMNLFMVLFSLPFWAVGIGMVWQILSTLGGRVRLHLNQQQISQAQELFGFKYKHSNSAPIQDISKLELECLGDANCRMIIWVGSQRYVLGGYGRMTEPELNWLADELSDWLRVPTPVKRLSN